MDGVRDRELMVMGTGRPTRDGLRIPTHHHAEPLTDIARKQWCCMYGGVLAALCFKLRDTAGLVPQQAVISEMEELGRLIGELGGVVFADDGEIPL